MKKYIIATLVLICSLSTKAQFSNTDTLRAFVNRWIRNSAVEAFQNLRLNTALIGMTNFIDSAYGGQVLNFEAVNDTTARLVTISEDTFSIYLRGNGITALRRRPGTDSVEYLKNGSGWLFAFKDSTGGSSITDGDKGDITVSSSGSVWTIDNNVVSDAKLRQSAGLSVIGNSTNSTANVSDIIASSDHQVLRRSGSGLGFGAINLASSNAVTGVLPIGNIDTAKVKDITNRRTGVLPTGYAGGSIIVDTAGKIKYADATRNNLVSFNNVTDTSAFGRPAAHFSRTNQQGLVAASNELLNLGKSSFSIGAWVKFDSLGANPQVIICKDDNRTKRGSEYYLGYYPDYNTGPYNGLVFQVEECCHASENDGNTWLVLSQASAISSNQWYFIVGMYDAVSGEVKISVNGVVDSAAAPVGGANITKTPFTIGSVSDDYDTTGLPEPTSFMNGTIASAFAFQRLLSVSEITSLYNNTDAQLDPPGINPGTMQNGAAFASDVPSVLSSYVNSVEYDGVNDKTALISGVSLNSGSSINLWFKADAFGGMLIGHSASSNAYVRVLNATTIRYQTNVTGTFADYTVPTMSTGTWYNLIVTRSAGNLTRIYLNGTESSTGGITHTDVTTIDQIGLYWDGTNAGLNWDGKISDVRFFNSELSGADISNIQSNSSTTASPFLWYKLNEGTGTTNIDYGEAAVPHPLWYDDLPIAFRYESPKTFISWWDLNEPYGVRYDARLRNTGGIRDSAVSNLMVDIRKKNQEIFGSTVGGGNLLLYSTTHATKGKIYLDSNSVFDGANRRLGIGITDPDFDLVIKNPSATTVDVAFRNTSDVNTLRIGVDGSANSNITAVGWMNITSGTSNPISLIPATGVTIGTARSTPYRLDVLDDRTGIADTNRAVYSTMTNSEYNTTTRVIRSSALYGLADGTRTTGSNDLINIGVFGKAQNGQQNWAGYFDGRIVVKEHTIASNSDSAVVWNRSTGAYEVAKINGSGGITSINSQTGTSQTISAGPGLAVNSSSDVHTISLNNTLDVQVTDANNTGTSATDLYSKTIAANQFTLNGQSIHFEAAGVNNDATATVNLEALFAGTSIAGTGAVTISGTGAWSIQGTIIRATSTTARVYTVVTIDNSTQKVFSSTANLTSLDFTATNILKIQATAGGAGGGNDDITAQMWKVVFQP